MAIFFMFLFYLSLIALGQNRKIEAAIKKYQKETNMKYKVDRSVSSMIERIFKFFCWKKIKPSEFDREFFEGIPLDYHIEPVEEVEMKA